MHLRYCGRDAEVAGEMQRRSDHVAVVPSGRKASELEAQNSVNILMVACFSMCQKSSKQLLLKCHLIVFKQKTI